MTHPAAKGERFIAVSGDMMSMLDIAKVLEQRMGDAAKKVPTRELPSWLVIIITPLANDELRGPRGAGYRRMIDASAARRAGTPDEVGTVGALLMGTDGAFITGSDFLMDGGVTAAYWFGDLAPQ